MCSFQHKKNELKTVLRKYLNYKKNQQKSLSNKFSRYNTKMKEHINRFDWTKCETIFPNTNLLKITQFCEVNKIVKILFLKVPNLLRTRILSNETYWEQINILNKILALSLIFSVESL